MFLYIHWARLTFSLWLPGIPVHPTLLLFLFGFVHRVTTATQLAFTGGAETCGLLWFRLLFLSCFVFSCGRNSLARLFHQPLFWSFLSSSISSLHPYSFWDQALKTVTNKKEAPDEVHIYIFKYFSFCLKFKRSAVAGRLCDWWRVCDWWRAATGAKPKSHVKIYLCLM